MDDAQQSTDGERTRPSDTETGTGVVYENADRAMLVVDEARRIRVTNNAARLLLDNEDGLSIDAHHTLRSPVRTAPGLQVAVTRATVRTPRATTAVICPRRSGARPYVLTVSPLGPAHGSDRRALVVIHDPALPTRAPAAVLLRQYFRLTASEARVARHLARGEDIAEIAAALGIARTTVRTHLQHVFDKTGTSRQAELATLLGRFPPEAVA
ncbi:helix-turn-helix transcriptional regulator [Tsukamurella sp. 8F]|uniref:helix-turn-helix transcriptional regulator n=1 Tax=unclassified Tsukamurella TaxID=2633480 RepID=UPI0023B8D982|nr:MULTISPECIES: helix-turn-helix transcriptional regulator [unclassified Tsukamurella]MDF0531425.1 helix-turn-helix transcriptional regulator [Tsukamurella sp. 8J]MDF0585269.1 helix-turn-helix transcriptional regulator [Tsukamurella sp. 8F]